MVLQLLIVEVCLHDNTVQGFIQDYFVGIGWGKKDHARLLMPKLNKIT